jgi:predicted transcriptional regulator
MKVLLSIKPEYANKIFDGSKQFEFRRTIFKEQVKTVLVYASSPTQLVIGEFEIEEILSDTLDNLWLQTKEFAGIDEAFFYQYFEDKQIGHAIKIKKTRKYRKPLCIREYLKLSPPQSFIYLQ